MSTHSISWCRIIHISTIHYNFFTFFNFFLTTKQLLLSHNYLLWLHYPTLYSSPSILYWLKLSEGHRGITGKLHHWLQINYMKCSHYILFSRLFSFIWLPFLNVRYVVWRRHFNQKKIISIDWFLYVCCINRLNQITDLNKPHNFVMVHFVYIGGPCQFSSWGP